MSTQTNKLGLFKYDPVVDKEELFDIQEALNDNWDKIDNSIKNADWNQNDESAPDFVKNKPVVFEPSDTLTWDGNTDGRTMVDVDDGVYMVHVSNSVPTLADFANGGSCTQIYPGGSANMPFSSDTAMDAGGGCIFASTMFFCVAPEDNAEIEGIVFPEKGVYLMCVPSEGVCFTSITINGYAGFVTEKLDPAYLYQPDWNQNDESAPDYVKNRPFYIVAEAPESITWDCDDKDGRESVDLMGIGVLHYKVSDITPSIEHAIGGKFTLSLSGLVEDTSTEILTSENVSGDNTCYAIANIVVFVILELTEGMPFTSTGVYMLDYIEYMEHITSASYDGLSAAYTLEFVDISKKIDEKFIPDTVATTDYVDSAIETAIGTAIGGSY